MNIQYKPQGDADPSKRINTNIGEFYPNEIKQVQSSQEKDAQTLIDNGEFIATDAEPNTDEAAQAAASAQSGEAGEGIVAKAKKVIKRSK